MHYGEQRERELRKNIWLKSVSAAKKVLKPGDRIRVSRCGGIESTYTFECWCGNWIVSKSGIDDLSASSISKVNGINTTF